MLPLLHTGDQGIDLVAGVLRRGSLGLVAGILERHPAGRDAPLQAARRFDEALALLRQQEADRVGA